MTAPAMHLESWPDVNVLTGGYWVGAHDADPHVVALYERHYSANPAKKGHHRAGIVGPGQKMVLLTTDARALFVWVYQQFNGDGQSGVMCSVFRNEGTILSSLLIEEAIRLAWHRWPGKRLFTYVWPAKIRSVNPGYCFKQAGFRTCGRNKDGRLTLLERLP